MNDHETSHLRQIDRDIGKLQAIMEMVTKRVDAQPAELAVVERRLELRQEAAENRLAASIEKLAREIEGWHEASERIWAEIRGLAKSAAERAASSDARLAAVEVEQSTKKDPPGGWNRAERLVTIVVLLIAMTLFGGDGAARVIQFLKMMPVAP